MGKTCVICDKPSGMYPLCKEHLQMKNEGKVIKCEDCGAWHLKDEPCPNCDVKYFKSLTDKIKNERRKCLFCGNDTEDGHLFCKTCYFKYKDKSLTVNVKNLTEFKIVDEYGNRNVKTQNGMYVRSQQEKIIYDELFSRKVRCVYENTVYYKDEKGETKALHPDFFLPDYNLYIEHWGYEDTHDPYYLKEKEFKEKIYKAQGKKFACTSGADIKDISAAIGKIFFENGIEIKD